MAMAVGGGKKGVMVDMNVTPLIDVLLVLIITFMVVTNLTPNGLDAIAPQPRPPQVEKNQPPDTTIVVSVDQNRIIKINQTQVEKSLLGSQLEDIFKTRNERIVFIKGDPTLLFQSVADVIDICKGANIDKIGLITAKLEEGQ